MNAGMQDADTGLCTVLSGRLTGMLPTEARKALILKDILSVPVPLCLLTSFSGALAAVCGLWP